MGTRLPRTGSTDLSDDELILLDALAEDDCQFGVLTAGGIAEILNIPETHNLSTDELLAVLSRLEDRGLIREDEGLFALTEEGGRVWDRERNPDWTRWCWWGTDRDPTHLLVWSPSKDLALEVYEIVRDCRVYVALADEPEVRDRGSTAVYPWKSLPVMFEARGRCARERFPLPRFPWGDRDKVQAAKELQDRARVVMCVHRRTEGISWCGVPSLFSLEGYALE